MRPERNDARGAAKTPSARNVPRASAKEGSGGSPAQSLGATRLLSLPASLGGSIRVIKKELTQESEDKTFALWSYFYPGYLRANQSTLMDIFCPKVTKVPRGIQLELYVDVKKDPLHTHSLCLYREQQGFRERAPRPAHSARYKQVDGVAEELGRYAQGIYQPAASVSSSVTEEGGGEVLPKRPGGWNQEGNTAQAQHRACTW